MQTRPYHSVDHPEFEARFWAQVRLTADIERCWIWAGASTERGYGRIKIKGRSTRTHRIAYYLTHGEWPEPACLHSCDNPQCVNPNHLRAGTQQQNVQEMKEKGRAARRLGQDCPAATFTNEQVRWIRERLEKEGRGSVYGIARELGVSRHTINRIKHNLTYPNA